MTKFILLLLCAFLVLVEPATALAESTGTAEALTETLAYPRVPRPVYKRYRGNSRSKHRKPGFFRRMKLRRQAKRKQATPVTRKAKGVIKVDAPVGTMPPKP
ncbi:hypothetical protein [Hymenobacter persicinus]|uniref:Uncharacterized protein n=1 Tax=Hymenobacter persicinus TaxID=2025506 RepID=A0A4Q5LCR7_9BACT|nr:hypothetical protein [Hymenobacter persicinus]RYU81023.1 hypothetical protein EWM57_07220 [Hymenobacter persicinus]